MQALLGVRPERTQADVCCVACDAQKDAQLLAVLVEAGIPVCDFHRERVTLERVFMEVMQDETQSNL